MRRRSLSGHVLPLALLACLGLALSAVAGEPEEPDTGTIPSPHIFMPATAPNAEVVLLSDAGGWGAGDESLAETLRHHGTLVIGIDLPRYLESLNNDGGQCIYTMTSVEILSHELQRRAGTADYRLPVIAGRGAGGALALAMAAQTPDATVGQTLAVDPEAGVAFTKGLCTQASEQQVGGLRLYGFEKTLADPVRIVLSPAAPPAGRAHAGALKQEQPAVTIAEAEGSPAEILARELVALVDKPVSAEGPLDLPLTVLDARPTRDTMAVIYSGDGGWRDIDKTLGAAFQEAGVPTVGVDSLRYFWHVKTPQETADDLARVLKLYRGRWGVGRVLLVGYSFGANILPPSFAKLGPADQASVAQISLLAFANETEFQISVSGWLGLGSADPHHDPVNDLKAIASVRLQCFYGTEEKDTACPRTAALGVEVVPIIGGHHFDGDYAAIARRILTKLDGVEGDGRRR